jgi:hypothetical protein
MKIGIKKGSGYWGINRGVNQFIKRPLIIIKVGNAMKTDKFVITALEVLLDAVLDAVVGINPKLIMVADDDKEARDGMTPEERSAIIIGLIVALISCAIVCYLRITNQIVYTPNTI